MCSEEVDSFEIDSSSISDVVMGTNTRGKDHSMPLPHGQTLKSKGTQKRRQKSMIFGKTFHATMKHIKKDVIIKNKVSKRNTRASQSGIVGTDHTLMTEVSEIIDIDQETSRQGSKKGRA